MKKLVFTFALALVAVVANAAGQFADRDRTYVHDLFATPQECEQAQHMGINCQQWATFGTDGRATLVVTDIVNSGTYSIEGNAVRLKLNAGGEVGGTLVFTTTDEFRTLTLKDNGTVWKLQPARD